MNRFIVVVAAALTAASVHAAGQSAAQAEKLLASAHHKATIDGDLKAAIAEYKRAVGAAGSNRALAALALLRMAECHQKLGDAEAKAIYQRLVRDYADQEETVAVARGRLAASAKESEPVKLAALPHSDGLPGTVTLDGRYLSLTSYSDGEVHLRDLRTGVDRAVTQRKDFNIGLSAVSKDGTRLAYEAYAGGCDGNGRSGSALCVLSLTATGTLTPKALVQRPDVLDIAPMDWSTDGRTIAVSIRREDRSAQVGLVDAVDGSLRVLQTVDWRGPTRMAFSPDGLDVAFDLPVSDTTDDRHIVTVGLDGSRGGVAVEHASQNIMMGWTPDGSMLLFTSNRGGSISLWAQPFSNRRPQGMPRLVRTGINGSWSAGVTRSGALYFGVSNSDRDISLMRVDLASGAQQGPAVRIVQRYVGTNSQPDWTADGKLLAFVSQRAVNLMNNVGRIVCVRDMTTGEERELRPKLLYFGPLSWSPSGDAILTSGTDIRGRNGVFRIDARTGEATVVVEGARNAYPRYSPDGKAVIYRRVEAGNFADIALVERALTSGAERVISRGEFGVFSVSPDGRSLAVSIGGLASAAAQSVVEIRLDSGETRDLLRAGPSERIPPYVAPRWTPDGKAVIVRKRSPNEIWFVPTGGGQPRRLDLDVRDWAFGPIGQFAIHPDGQRIAFLSGALSNEVMVLENFLPAQSTAVPAAKK